MLFVFKSVMSWFYLVRYWQQKIKGVPKNYNYIMLFQTKELNLCMYHVSVSCISSFIDMYFLLHHSDKYESQDIIIHFLKSCVRCMTKVLFEQSASVVHIHLPDDLSEPQKYPVLSKCMDLLWPSRMSIG